jgi:ribosomal protein S27AE
MSILTDAKEVADLVKKLGDIELYRKIVELEGQILELTREKRETENALEQLRASLKLRDEMVFKKPFYFRAGDKVPHCPNCWEVKSLAVHLDGPTKVMAGPRYDCHNCQTTIIDKDGHNPYG